MTPTLLALHRWVGLLVGLLILVAAVTVLLLNHQDLLLRPTHATTAGDPYGRYLQSVWVDPQDARHVLTGTSDGLFRSADGGRQWEEVVLPVPAEQVVGLAGDPRHPKTVYAAFRLIGLYKSEDGGEVWEEVPLTFNPAATTIQALAVTAAGPCLLTTGGLYAAAGGTWSNVPPPVQARQADARKPLALVYDLHDGKFWGAYGVPVTDAVGIALVLLVFSGYVLFFGRWVRVRRARRRAVVV